MARRLVEMGMSHYRSLTVLVLVLAVLVGQPVGASSADLTDYPLEFLTAVNIQRAEQGLPPLGTAPALHADGQHWAQALATDELDLVHRSPTDLVAAGVGDWSIVGENLARFAPSSQATADLAGVMEAFMDSPSHRANVLGGYTGLDSAVAVAHDGTVYVVMTFIG